MSSVGTARRLRLHIAKRAGATLVSARPHRHDASECVTQNVAFASLLAPVVRLCDVAASPARNVRDKCAALAALEARRHSMCPWAMIAVKDERQLGDASTSPRVLVILYTGAAWSRGILRGFMSV